MSSLFDTFVDPATAATWLTVMTPLLAKGALILALTGALTWLLRGSAAALRHLVWVAAVVGILALPIISGIMPDLNLHVPAYDAVVGVDQIQEAPMAFGDGVWTATGTAVVAPEADVAESSSALSAPIGSAVSKLAALPWSVWAMLVWVIGSVALLVRLGLSHVGVITLVRRSERIDEDDWHERLERLSGRLNLSRHVRLRRSEWVSVPVSVGAFKPVIVIPAEADHWDDATRDTVLLHELAHVKRRDCLSQVLVELTKATHWINPLVWLADIRMRMERERACDDLVISSGTRPSTYAETLLEIAKSLRGKDWSPVAVMAMARKSELEGRVLDILDDSPRLRTVNKVGAALAVFVVAVLVLPIAALQPAQASSNAQDIVASFGGTFNFEMPEQRFDIHVDVPDVHVDIPPIIIPPINIQIPDFDVHALQHAIEERDHGNAFDGDELDDILDEIRSAMEEVERSMDDLSLEFGSVAVCDDDLTIGQRIELKRHGLDADDLQRLREIGYAELCFDDLLMIARQGVDLDYIEDLADAGMRALKGEEIVRLCRHGVDADFIESMVDAGFEQLDVDQYIDMARHGVDEDLVEELMDMDHRRFSPADVIRMTQHGVSGDFASEALAAFPNISVDDLIRLTRHGVCPEDIAGFKRDGFAHFTVEDAVKLTRNGMDVDELREYVDADGGSRTIDDYIVLQRHGVDADLIDELADIGYSFASVDQLANIVRHGIDADGIEDLVDHADEEISLDNAVVLLRYDIDGDFLEALQDAGFDDISIDKMIELRQSGVDADDIRDLKEW